MLNLWSLSPSRQIALQSLAGDGRYLVFASSDNGYAVLAHQPANASVPNIQADLFQLFCHPRPALAAQAETGLFIDMCKCHQIGPQPATGGTAAEGPECSSINLNLMAFGPRRTALLFLRFPSPP